jgi:hypothetical protein
MNKEPKSENTYLLIRSLVALRRAVGILGVILPFAVLIGAYLIDRTGVQSSISHYYYTVMRNYLVGTLWAMGFFLMFYKGYECADDVASSLGGLFSIGASLFPTAPDACSSITAQWIGRIHLAFAVLFLTTLAYMSICQFTKTYADSKLITKEKRIRNKIYSGCGFTMLGCLLCLGVCYYFSDKLGTFKQNHILEFGLESVAVIAFGASWLIKGETLFTDKDVQPKSFYLPF